MPRRTCRRSGPAFKMMVAALHAAGIEVILDVVYNHTAEGNQMGPTLSLRGIDNRRIISCRQTISVTIWITPAVAIRSTCAIHACCSSLWTVCATGPPRCTSTVSALISPHTGAELYEVDHLGRFFRHHPPGP